MRKAKVTYHAPEGDAKSVTMNGVIFNDDEPVELNSDDHSHLMNKGADGQQISKIEGNPHFEVEMGDEEQSDKPRRGRPSNAEKAARETEAG